MFSLAGACRDLHGKRANYHAKDGITADMCKAACEASGGRCVAYQTHGESGGQCAIIGEALNGNNAPNGGGWSFHSGDSGSNSILTVVNDTGHTCYRKKPAGESAAAQS